jgi:hypothetical protein
MNHLGPICPLPAPIYCGGASPPYEGAQRSTKPAIPNGCCGASRPERGPPGKPPPALGGSLEYPPAWLSLPPPPRKKDMVEIKVDSLPPIQELPQGDLQKPSLKKSIYIKQQVLILLEPARCLPLPIKGPEPSQQEYGEETLLLEVVTPFPC